jgi:hypothetical protein
LFRTDLPKVDRPSAAGRFGHGLRKRRRARPRHLIDLPGVTPIRQRGDDDLGDVVGVMNGSPTAPTGKAI